jgi:Ca2+-binding RTX toxin-like protein
MSLMKATNRRRGAVLLPLAVVVVAGPAGLAVRAEAATTAAGVYCPSARAIVGTTGNNRLVGTPADDLICAGPGDDQIYGMGGNDRVYAGAGNDHVVTGDGMDAIYGGTGNDRIFAGGGTDTVYGWYGAAFTLDPGDATIDGNDEIHGGKGSDAIDGGDGDDVIYTDGDGENRNGGSSITRGGNGNDVLLSDSRNVTVTEYFYGGPGDDVLWPAATRTSLLGNVAQGGPGNDVLVMVNGARDAAQLQTGSSNVVVPLGIYCKISVPSSGKPGSKGTLDCNLPIKGASLLIKGFSVTVQVGNDGRITLSGTFQTTQAEQSAELWWDAARSGFTQDHCVCDDNIAGWPFTGDDVTE